MILLAALLIGVFLVFRFDLINEPKTNNKEQVPEQRESIDENEPNQNRYSKEKDITENKREEQKEDETDNFEELKANYIKVTDSCEFNFEGDCLNVRSGPGTKYDVVNRLRSGTVLKVEDKIEGEDNNWYKITFKDEWIRYPERVEGDWYVATDYVEGFQNEGDKSLTSTEKLSDINKKIVVDESDQKLYAYEGEDLFMEINISTGLLLTPTPTGTFRVFKKMPSRYMQGPIPGVSSKYWDLPGVPWNLYFTAGGAVIHGTYWHNNFGSPSSNGCVNVKTSQAEKLYKWAPVGTKVVIQE